MRASTCPLTRMHSLLNSRCWLTNCTKNSIYTLKSPCICWGKTGLFSTHTLGVLCLPDAYYLFSVGIHRTQGQVASASKSHAIFIYTNCSMELLLAML